MPKVDFKREEIVALTPRWDLVRDCISGSKAIKDKGDKYLPRPNPEDKSAENQERYKQYKERAVFYGVTGRTLRGMVGEVFRRKPVIKLNPQTELLETDADGGGVSLEQMATKGVSHLLAYARFGLLADYPPVEGATTKADLDAGNIRPTLTLFDPWDVINWRVATIGGKKLLTLVVISESEVTNDDGFEQKTEQYWRVLRLNTEGFYISEIWYWDDKQNDFVLEETFVPRQSNGQVWPYIPFTFAGSENNDPTPDLPPLYDLAELNVAHYRNSADYEESAYIVGQPTPYFAGLTTDWVKDVLKNSIPLGARAAVPLPEGGSAGLLQAAPNTLPFEAMQHKERQMVALGAKLVEQTTVQRTATEAGIEEASASSVLAKCAVNCSAAFTAALKWACLFVGEDPADKEFGIKLNSDFEISKLPAAELQAVVQAWQGGAITFSEMREQLRKGGRATLDDEEAKAELESEAPDTETLPGKPGAVENDPDADPDADPAATK